MEVNFQRNFTGDFKFSRRCYEDCRTGRHSAKSMEIAKSVGFLNHNSLEAHCPRERVQMTLILFQ